MIEKVLMCEVCRKEVAVGVASTMIPYSAAFGRRCLINRAQPRWIVDAEIQEYGVDGKNGPAKAPNYFDPGFLDYVTVFMPFGEYLTVREYITYRKLHGR
jgi:hypothetical protein